jgi:hypothetical protein
MPNTASKHYWKVISIAGAFAGLAAWPGIGQAQLGGLPLPPLPPLPGGGDGGGATQVVSQASGVTAVINGNVTSLVDTGTLSSASEPLGTGVSILSIPGLLSAEAVHAATMGWTDQVVSESSLGSLAMTVAGTGISADFIMSRAQTVSGVGATGLTSIDGLNIGGVPISPTGVPNQAISLPGLSVILNEQIQSAGGIVVNALRIRTLDGLTDVILGSSKAAPL